MNAIQRIFNRASSVEVSSALPISSIDELPQYKRVCFLSDIFRVDDRVVDKAVSPCIQNTKWLYTLLGPILKVVTERTPEILLEFPHPDPLSRMNFYRRTGREFNSSVWASFYDNLNDKAIEEDFSSRFEDALVISYELPPYLIRALTSARIPYIDFSIHPVRFLPDYVFGVRSNIRSISERLISTQIPHEIIYDFARISAARTANVFRSQEPLPGSFIFFGQLTIDASLVSNGRLATFEDVKEALSELSINHSRVYYRAHPHCENPERIKEELKKFPRVRWVEWNSYDVISLQTTTGIGALSSGILHEASYFGTPAKRFLPGRSYFYSQDDHANDIFPKQLYTAAPPASVQHDYWRYIFHGGETPPLKLPEPSAQALRFVVNMKWGR